MKFFNRVRRNDDGSAAVEFAFTAPLLILTIVAIMEFSMILFLNALLEGNLRDAARFGATGSMPVGVSRENFIIQKLRDATLGFVAVDANQLTVLAYTNFNEVGRPEPFIDSNPANGVYDAGESFTDVNGNGQWDADMGKPGLDGACDVVVYRIQTQWNLLLGLLANTLGNSIELEASTAVRNEPYGGTPC